MEGIDFEVLYSEATGTPVGNDAANTESQDQGLTLDALLTEIEQQDQLAQQAQPEQQQKQSITQGVDQVSADLAMYGLGGMEGPAQPQQPQPEEQPVTAAEWHAKQFEELPLTRKLVELTRNALIGVAHGDNLLANAYKAVSTAIQGPQEGETPEQFQQRVKVEEELSRAAISSLPGSKAGEVLADIALMTPVVASAPFTLPAEIGIGAAYGASEELLSEAAKGDLASAEAVAESAAINAVAGAAGYGLIKVGAGLIAKAAQKAKVSPEKAIESLAKGGEGLDPETQSKLANGLITEAEAVAREADKLKAAGMDPVVALDTAAVRTGAALGREVKPDKVARKAALAAKKIRQRQLNQARYLEQRAAKGNKTRKIADEWFGQVNQRLEMISAPIGNQVKRLDAEVSVLRGFANQHANRLVKAIKIAKLSRRERRKLNVAMLNGPEEGLKYLRGIGKETPELREAIQASARFIEGLGETALKGSKVEKLPAGKYWPRRAKSGEHGSKTTKDDEIMAILGVTRKIRETGSVKERQVRRVDETNAHQYLDFTESWRIAANELIHSNSTRKFLGKGYKLPLAPYNVTKERAIDKFIEDAWKRGELLDGNLEETKQLLKSRLIDFETPSSTATSVLQSLTRTAFLSNPGTALAQLTDAANLFGIFGPRAFLSGVFRRLPKQLRADETGLIHNALQEAGITNGTPAARMVAKFSDWALKTGGMTGLDKMMTNRGMSIARRALLRKLKNPVKREELKQELVGWASPEELDRIFDDVVKDKLNFDTLALYVAEYSKAKPVLTGQKSQAFGKAASGEEVSLGRLWGTIKSFMVHQLGIVRREIVNEWNFGSRAKASKKLLGLASAWALIGGTVEGLDKALFGGEAEISDSMVSGLLAMTGMSPFVLRNAAVSPDLVAQSLWLPAPASAASRVAGDIGKAIREEGDYTWLRNVPVLSWVYYAAWNRDREEVKAAMEAQKEINQSLKNPRMDELTWGEAREYRGEQTRQRLERYGL